MKNLSMHLRMLLLAFGLVVTATACSKKTKTTAGEPAAEEEVDQEPVPSGFTPPPSTATTDDGGTVGSENDGGDGDDEVDESNLITPTCTIGMSNYTQDNLEAFYYKDVPHADTALGDLNYCLKLDDSSGITAETRFEYSFFRSFESNTLETIRVTFREGVFFYGEITDTSIKLIWMDSAGFLGILGSKDAADSEYTAATYFANMPGSGIVANTDYEASCLDGTRSTEQCVQNRIFHKTRFWERLLDGSLTDDETLKMVAMIEHYLKSDFPTEFDAQAVVTGMLADGMQFSLSEARSGTVP